MRRMEARRRNASALQFRRFQFLSKRQQQHAAVPAFAKRSRFAVARGILDVGRMHDAGLPFSALLTLWLATMAALGLASRPACSRHCTYSAWDALQGAVLLPAGEVVVHGAARGHVLGGVWPHWQRVLRIDIRPLTTSRTSTVRLLPPRLGGGINGATSVYSSSVRSLGWRSSLRS